MGITEGEYVRTVTCPFCEGHDQSAQVWLYLTWAPGTNRHSGLGSRASSARYPGGIPAETRYQGVFLAATESHEAVMHQPTRSITLIPCLEAG